MRRSLRHHRFLGTTDHFVQRAVAEAIRRRPRRRVLAHAVVAAGEGVAHVRRLAVGGEVASRAVPDLRAAVLVGERRRPPIELHRFEAVMLAIGVDETEKLLPQSETRFIQQIIACGERTLALRERAREQNGDADEGAFHRFDSTVGGCWLPVRPRSTDRSVCARLCYTLRRMALRRMEHRHSSLSAPQRV